MCPSNSQERLCAFHVPHLIADWSNNGWHEDYILNVDGSQLLCPDAIQSIILFLRDNKVNPRDFGNSLLTPQKTPTTLYMHLLAAANIASAVLNNGGEFFGAMTFILIQTFSKWIAIMIRQNILVEHTMAVGGPLPTGDHWEYCAHVLDSWNNDPSLLHSWILVHIKGIGPRIDAAQQEARKHRLAEMEDYLSAHPHIRDQITNNPLALPAHLADFVKEYLALRNGRFYAPPERAPANSYNTTNTSTTNANAANRPPVNNYQGQYTAPPPPPPPSQAQHQNQSRPQYQSQPPPQQQQYHHQQANGGGGGGAGAGRSSSNTNNNNTDNMFSHFAHSAFPLPTSTPRMPRPQSQSQQHQQQQQQQWGPPPPQGMQLQGQRQPPAILPAAQGNAQQQLLGGNILDAFHGRQVYFSMKKYHNELAMDNFMRASAQCRNGGELMDFELNRVTELED